MIQHNVEARSQRLARTRDQSQTSTQVTANRKVSVVVEVPTGDSAKGTIPHGVVVDLQMSVGSGIGHVVICALSHEA